MHLKLILKNLDSRSIFTILVGLAMITYGFYFKDEFDENSTKQVTGSLSYLPYLEQSGDDIVDYSLMIGLDGFQNDFEVKDCFFTALSKSQIDLLETGDKVTLTVKALTNPPYAVYGIQSGNMKLINLEEAIGCYNNGWKKTGSLILLYIIILILDVKRVLNKGTSSKSE